MNKEQLLNRHSRAAAITALSLIALSASASASNTGGTAFDKNPPAPAIAQLDSKGACPKVEKISSKSAISGRCQKFLFKTLRNSVYDSANPAHAVAAYQSVAKLKNVDGIAGPKTTRSILQGKSLKVSVPSARFAKQSGVLVDKSEQVAYLMSKSKYTGKGKVSHIIKVSTGTEQEYTDTITTKDGTVKTVSGRGDTPTGNKFIIDRVYGADYDESDLGPMPYARFINHMDGIAIHTGNVPTTLQRLSHGCIRVPANDMTSLVVPAVGMGTAFSIRE